MPTSAMGARDWSLLATLTLLWSGCRQVEGSWDCSWVGVEINCRGRRKEGRPALFHEPE